MTTPAASSEATIAFPENPARVRSAVVRAIGDSVDLTAEDLLDAKAAGKILGVEPRTVTAWAREGRMPCLRLGPKTIRWTRAMLEEWAASKLDPGRPF
jgi:excisionase family DNA binding protein